jgi:hypothetical protein
MLGISTPDAIALGTLILAALAAWQGGRAGATAARRPAPPDPTLALIGGALVDHLTLLDLVEAVRALEATIGRAAEERERREESGFADALRRLESALIQDRFD